MGSSNIPQLLKILAPSDQPLRLISSVLLRILQSLKNPSHLASKALISLLATWVSFAIRLYPFVRFLGAYQYCSRPFDVDIISLIRLVCCGRLRKRRCRKKAPHFCEAVNLGFCLVVVAVEVCFLISCGHVILS